MSAYFSSIAFLLYANVCFHKLFLVHYKKCMCKTILSLDLFIFFLQESWADSFLCLSFFKKNSFLVQQKYSWKTSAFPQSLYFCHEIKSTLKTPLIQNSKLHLIYAGIYLHKVGVHRFKTLCKHSTLACPMELPASFLFIHDIWEWGILLLQLLSLQTSVAAFCHISLLFSCCHL